MKKLLEKILSLLDKVITKHHKCKNYIELHSATWETFGQVKMLTNAEYKCSICNKKIMEW
jgi:hypothetical protein